MRIVIDQGAYNLLNMGDVAMLQVAIARLKKQWPDSHISVCTDSPQRLQNVCLGTYPLHISGRNMFFDTGTLLGSLNKFAPGLEESLRQRSPEVAQKIFAIKKRLVRQDPQFMVDFIEAIRNADLVIASGGGYLADAFPSMVHNIYRTFLLAKRFNKPMMLLGQGIGPINDVALRKMLSEVLRGAKIIALREKRTSPQLLKQMGVKESRIKITGDDAIEMAFMERREEMGYGIGVNLRLSSYSEVKPETISDVKSALKYAIERYSTSTIPVPIAFHNNGTDSRSIQGLLSGIDDNTDGGITLTTPQAVIHQISHCRIVVTGSYHAAVFALAQGIPAIGLAKSEYYVDKFKGLADQFGEGCQVVILDAPNVLECLKDAIDQSWKKAERISPQLLQSALKQIEAGKAVYDQLAYSISS